MPSMPNAVPSLPTVVGGENGHVGHSNTVYDEVEQISKIVVGPREFNVKGYGAVGDSATDDTAEIQACLDAAAAAALSGASAAPTVFFPPGRYEISSTLTWPAKVHIRGSGVGPFGTIIRWNGTDGGTAIYRNDTNRRGISGIRFGGGTASPGIWIHHDSDIDFGDFYEDIYFEPTSATAGVAALVTGTVINFFMRRMRFSGGSGYAIEIRHENNGPTRPVCLDQFTIDHSLTGSTPVFKGFLHLIMGGTNTNLSIEIANGRVEGDTADLGSPGSFVHIESSPVNSLNARPADITLRNIDWQSAYVSLVHQTTTQTTINSSVNLYQVRGLSGELTGALFGGTWFNTIPQIPEGEIGTWNFSRRPSGSTKWNRNFFSDLSIGGVGTTALQLVASATASLNFGSIAANTTAELTIAVTGAAIGDTAVVTPNGSPETGLVWSGRVSATDTVTVRLGNVTIGAIDPAARTWRADVLKYG